MGTRQLRRVAWSRPSRTAAQGPGALSRGDMGTPWATAGHFHQTRPEQLGWTTRGDVTEKVVKGGPTTTMNSG